jgi:Fe-S-cluster containining protein
MSPSEIDCTSCGACCFGAHERYVALLPEDRGRAVPIIAVAEVDGRRFLRMQDGHCAKLHLSDGARLVCGIYEHRPEACRAFRAGSFECGRARHHRGMLAAAMRNPPPEPAPIELPAAAENQGPEAALPPAHVIASVSKGRSRPPA